MKWKGLKLHRRRWVLSPYRNSVPLFVHPSAYPEYRRDLVEVRQCHEADLYLEWPFLSIFSCSMELWYLDRHHDRFGSVLIEGQRDQLRPLRLFKALQWRHNEHDGVSNHQPYDCLLNRLFKAQLKETSKLHGWPLWGEFTGHRWIPRTKGQ